MSKKIHYLILFMIIAGYLCGAGYYVYDAPMLCWDGAYTDPDTGLVQSIGGCEPDYEYAVKKLIIPTCVWLAIIIIYILIYIKIYIKKKNIKK